MSSQSTSSTGGGNIRAIDSSSVHRITSGQVVIDLQTAVKELVENSLDAGANNIEIRFKNYGLKSIEVVDNGSGISETDFDSIGRKHHTSKLSAFHDLTTLTSFGFRGEALSSLCALCESVTVTTAAIDKAPMGAVLELDKRGEVKSKAKAVRQRGTTVTLTAPFIPLPVRRKELERNIKREFGKALALLNAYALGPCSGLGSDKPVRLLVTNQPEKGAKTTQISLPLPSSLTSTSSLRTVRAGTTALWGSKALDSIVDLELEFEVPKITGKVKSRKSKADESSDETFTIGVKGLISSPSLTPGSGSTPRPGTNGRTSSDRQFFYVNGRPCTMNKVQKVINEVYRTFLPSNSTSGQFPVVVIDFSIPGDAVDVNVTPDKRTILVHAEAELCERMKDALEELYSPSRSTYGISDSRTMLKGATMMDKRATTGGDGDRQDSDEVEEATISEQIPKLALAKSPRKLTSLAGIQPIDEDEDSMDVDDLQGSTLASASNGHHSAPLGPLQSPAIRKSRTSSESQVVVMNTSTASWNRPKDVSGRSEEGDSLEIGRLKSPAAHAPDVAEEEPPRKKRRSAISLADDDVDSEPAAEGQGVYGKGTSQAPTAKVPATITRQIKLTDMFRGKTTRQEMRSQLAGFARSGSQVPHLSSDVEDEEEDEEDELDQQQDVHSAQEGKEEVGAAPSRKTEPQINASPKSTDGPLFLPEDDIIVDSSDDAPSSGGLGFSTSSTVSTSTSATTPLATSSVADNKVSLSDKSSEMVDLALDDDDDDNSLSLLSSAVADESNNPIHLPEVIRTEASQSTTGDVRLRFDLSGISQHWTKLHSKLCNARAKRVGDRNDKTRGPSSLAKEAGVSSADVETSEAALSRIISKQDFKEMEVVGQFNLGFIVVRRRKRDTAEEPGSEKRPSEGSGAILDDLFIVDQHAADEKYNFETLQQTTSIKSQKLFKPRPLALIASDELVALENIDILTLNGFELEVDEDLPEQDDPDIEMLDESGDSANHQGKIRRRLKLVAQPVSKSTVFDMRDLEELIQLMQDRPKGQMVRCSKARAMFASRACRKSVMIGMPLTKGQMSTVVTHMGTIDQPWNCPHGRPTMRHLFDVANIQPSSQNDRAHREIDWASFEKS
ncbi:hypothetical protein GYMLUDRAFT_34203 [Collybiopsis luxurians FD-317 M1]|nr:hypothetical protein GYMLUDRAFT_34203 [Collybiopsis luxurians FD-317 M1]